MTAANPSRRRVILGATGLGFLGLTGAAAALLRAPAAAPAAGPSAPATATVDRETLVETVVVDGSLAYGPELRAESRLTGTLTGLPSIGATVTRGQVLFRIDNTPVVLFYGALPAYRALTAVHPAVPAGAGPAEPAVPATTGDDVQQFEENLKALGYGGFTVDGDYSASTVAAVKKWQADLKLPPTGVVELGRVFYAPGPVRIAKLTLSPGAIVSGPVLTYTGTARMVSAEVPAHQQEVAKAGAKVTIVLPSGRDVPGSVTLVRTPDQQNGPEPTVEAAVAPDDQAAVNGLDDGPVRVQFEAQRRENVLVVPVGALLALAEGGYGLQIIDGGGSRIVAVTTGLFANGKVEVSGPDVREGLTVGMAK